MEKACSSRSERLVRGRPEEIAGSFASTSRWLGPETLRLRAEKPQLESKANVLVRGINFQGNLTHVIDHFRRS